MSIVTNTPLSDDITEILNILNEIDPNPQVYHKHLEILLDNMDEHRYYPGAKNELKRYIELLKKTGHRTAEESDIKQSLYEKLRKGNVIPNSIIYATNIPGKSGEVIVLSKIRTGNVLDGK